MMLRSFFPSISHGLVDINIPGRTCLREPFIEYEQVTAWVARFSFKLEANYHQPPSALDGSMGRRTSHRRYSLVKLQITSWKEPLAELLTRFIRDHLQPAAVTSTFCVFTSCYQHQ